MSSHDEGIARTDAVAMRTEVEDEALRLLQHILQEASRQRSANQRTHALLRAIHIQALLCATVLCATFIPLVMVMDHYR